ncbi:four-carbon acid sugar kinase family protein [Paracoccus sp. (in: a-proteobacteria)]|uniref:four-carbon acid sugar kinase family protein n=1 Tax=Paracoccus sp. TaxID=267 RepID=UPI003A898667
MPLVLVLADDLTGALDSAVAFASPGWRVLVARSPSAVPAALAAAPDVLAVNTGSREVAAGAASAQVKAALAHLSPDDFQVVMKKVDSRLKGHPGAETAELAIWMGAARCVAAPAIPDMGRVVSGGLLIGPDVPRPVDIASCFTQPVECPDSLDQSDLDALVAAGDGPVLWVGARGLAMALARRQGIGATPAPGLNAPVLIANGSRDPITQAQIAALAGVVPVAQAPDGHVPEGVTGPVAVISITDGGGGLDGAGAGRSFAQGTAAAALRIQPRGLLICGGETAQAVLDQLRVDHLQVIAEFRPGLPMCIIGTSWGQVRLVTKSGGFGAPSLLRDILLSSDGAS